MTVQERIRNYEVLAADSQRNIDRLKRRIYFHGIFRLTLFVGSFFVVYALTRDLWLLAIVLLVLAVAFAWSLRQHNSLSDERESAESLLRIAEDELKAFRHDFSVFDGAPEKTDPAHAFSFDLDIFGDRSVFQQINRTSLPAGRERLAAIIQYPLTGKEEIKARQQAIAELAGKEDFCLRFRMSGMKISSHVGDAHVVSAFNAENGLSQSLFWRWAVGVVPLLYPLFIVLWLTGVVHGGLFLYLYLFTLALSVLPMKKVKATWLLFDKKSKLLDTYASLLKLLEQEKVVSPLLISLQKQLTHNKKASEAIGELSQYSRNLDVGFTLAMLILNPLFLWTTRYARKIEHWMKKHGQDIESWFAVLAEADALISMGTFALNHPGYTYPEIADSDCFRGKGLGHPLIPQDKCVKNDIDISRKPYFMIVTGANMAGKSTYLRTIGVNHVLASVGLPVCADELTFFPGRLLTNLRTSDSLVNSESYFMAELKRLRMIIDWLEGGEEGLLIILDEILKGTNSEDKQRGSLALMKRLIGLGGNGIIATHDLALGNLEDEYPQEIKNWHFDAVIRDDALTFSYRLQEGIARNMNASFLMRKMGITE
ncbi:MAG: hypothetical protein LLF81_01545 [Porphyromonadaceae bacterium]|nr:hypothetical protein [Porphyromonadaceae bacterium]